MDNFETEIENEGEINIPKISSKPVRFLIDKNKNFSLLRINSFCSDHRISSSNLSENYYQPDDQCNYTSRINKNKINLKNEDGISISESTKVSRGSINYKIKKVTFSTVEIIRIENYKKYNKLNTAKKSENYKIESDNYCIMF
jgi:hypothetical protein